MNNATIDIAAIHAASLIFIEMNYGIEAEVVRVLPDTFIAEFGEDDFCGRFSEHVVEAVAAITKIHGKPEVYDDHHGTQYTWDFDDKRRVAIYARWSSKPEITLMQFK